MGCRESKLDVVAGNTTTHAKRSKSGAKRCVPPEMSPEDKSSCLVEAVAVAAALAAAEGRATGILMDIGKEREAKRLDRIKKDAQEGEEIEKSVCVESPNHFFSPRQEEESLDFISAEERSEYSSPPHEAAAVKEIRMEDAVEEGRAERERIQEDEPHNKEEERLMKDPHAMSTPPKKILGIEEKIETAEKFH